MRLRCKSTEFYDEVAEGSRLPAGARLMIERISTLESAVDVEDTEEQGAHGNGPDIVWRPSDLDTP